MGKLNKFYSQYIEENKSWFIVMMLWFFICTIVGAIYFFIDKHLLKFLVDTIAAIAGDSRGWQLFWSIYSNNTIVALLVIFLGILFGLLPFAMVAFNGFLLGYISAAVISTSTMSLLRTLFILFGSLAPHGIIELPIIFLSAAIGARLGLHWILNIFNKETVGNRWTSFKRDCLFAFATVPIVVFGLAVAAIIESFITAFLVHKLF